VTRAPAKLNTQGHIGAGGHTMASPVLARALCHQCAFKQGSTGREQCGYGTKIDTDGQTQPGV
jgi:hypothetical protein